MISLRSAIVASTNPFRVKYDGESKPSQATPKRLSSYNPVLSDRVIILKVFNVSLCLGKVV